MGRKTWKRMRGSFRRLSRWVRRRPRERGPELDPKILHICTELLTTEQAYVHRLQLVVQAKEMAARTLNQSTANEMFKDIEVIHQFHSENLLPQLEERMAQWEQFRKIGDIMENLAPFLKLYTAYVKDFQKSANLVDTYEGKSAAFASGLEEIKKSQGEREGHLTIKAHMMEPVQRVPRYELLLKDYIKRIPENYCDREDAEKALQSVSEAASHFEDMMNREGRMVNLMKVQSRIVGDVNIVRPSRVLIREGGMQRVNSKRGKTSHKYLFLFNDSLMVCKRQTLVGKSLRVRHNINLKEFESLSEGRNLEVPHTFCLKCGHQEYELCADSAAEMQKWVDALTGAISALMNTEVTYPGACDPSTLLDKEDELELTGQMSVSFDEGRSWKKRWLALHNNGTLIAGKPEQEVAVHTSINSLQFNKSMVEAGKGGTIKDLVATTKKGRLLLLAAESRKYYFHDDDGELVQRWYDAMVKIGGGVAGDLNWIEHHVNTLPRK